MKNKIILATTLIILIGASLIYFLKPDPVTPPPAEKIHIRHGYTAQIPQPVFIALQKGYFAEAGLDVELQPFSNSNLVLEAMSRGDLDVGGIISYSTLLAFENKSPDKLKIYHGFSETTNTGFSSLIVKKDSGITDPKQLRGKKIVMRTGLSSKSVAELVLTKIGLPPAEVEFVQVDYSLLVQTFAQPDIAAFLDIQPFATMIVEQGLGEVLIVSPRAKYIIDPYPLAGAVASTDFVTTNPEAYQKFRAAINKAIDFIDTNEPEARIIFQKYLDLAPNIAQKMPLGRYEKLVKIDHQAINKLADFEVEHKILDQKPDISGWFQDPWETKK